MSMTSTQYGVDDVNIKYMASMPLTYMFVVIDAMMRTDDVMASRTTNMYVDGIYTMARVNTTH
jgi:hypothetical protein